MLLSHRTAIKLNSGYSNIIGHMCYAASRLWNVCNYERHHYKELGLTQYPDWYYQKKFHKNNMWYKSLPSQTAQEVCKLLDKSWKSFYALQKSGGIENPRPPRFKHDSIAITYMQKGIVHDKGSARVRLSLPKQLKEYMSANYGIHENYLFLENQIFRNMDIIKQMKIYPPVNGKCDIIVIYDVPDVEPLPDNGHYLSIDLGLHNLMTCVDSSTGKSFIVGRKYLSICRYYDKEISRVQEQWYKQQVHNGIRYPKTSTHVQRLYMQKQNAINDCLHKITRYIADYCHDNHINTVVIGDMKGIRKGRNLGHSTNQKLHSLPYGKIYQLLEYKLALYGIRLVKQKEAYSSQCSPLSENVSKTHALKSNRKFRGLYCDGNKVWNADAVGAYNILRLYMQKTGIRMPEIPLSGLSNPEVIKVAA